MKLANKAREVFDKLFNQAYWWAGRHSPDHIRDGKVGKPGELVERMSAEDREALQNLKSDDIAEGKIPQGEVALAAENGKYYTWKEYDKMLREAKLKFDSKIVKDPPRADRKKY